MPKKGDTKKSTRRAALESEIPPSQWQLKYSRPPRLDSVPSSDDDDNESLTEWIAKVQEKASAAAALETSLASASLPELDAPLAPALVKFDEPVDSDVAEVMLRMEKILSGASHDDNLMFGGQSLNAPILEFDEFSFDFVSLTINDQNSTALCDPLINKFDKNSFSSEQMVILFRKNRDEKIARKCLRSLANHCRREKKRLSRSLAIAHTRMQGKMLGKYFLLWKHSTRMSKVKEAVLICKFGRATSKVFRKAFSSWRRMATDHNEVLSVAFDKRRLRMLRRTISSWNHVICTQLQLRQKKIVTRRKLRVFCIWRQSARIVRALRVARIRRHELAHQKNIARLLRHHFSCWLETSRSRANQDSDEPQLIKPEPITTRGSRKCGNFNDTPTSCASAKTKGQKTVTKGSPDKENQRPNVERSNVLLKPLSEKKRPHCLKSSTPKLVLDMQKRGMERERRRKALQVKYAEAAAQKRKREEEARKRKEEQESLHQNEYFQQKAEEEERKQAAAARRKQAFRLASLHYKMTLQRRIFNQWTKVFQILTFNEQKAHLAWCDATKEICFGQWKYYTRDEKLQKMQRMIKRCQLANDFNERRLLAKSFAAWEEQCYYTKSILSQVHHKVSQRRKHLIFTTWRNLTIRATSELSSKEENAKKFGRRLHLKVAIHQWRTGTILSKKEREMEKLIEAKMKQVKAWLGE